MTTCAHCRIRPGVERWKLALCAMDGEKISKHLCTECDVELNIHVMAFFNVLGALEMGRKYEEEE